eukprot:gb/GECG01013782.1/.p1 GENE.gb/GECG01013782.1/~~gb/GECG01013782.1/.p1  ORF type:complete len:744 (+),score=86.77 gb/GECG01013782.1/:1-2232(+)
MANETTTDLGEWRQTAESVLLGPEAPTQDDIASQIVREVEGHGGVFVDKNRTIRVQFDQIPRAILECIHACSGGINVHEPLCYWINLLAKVLYRSPLSKAVFDYEDLFRQVLEAVANHVTTELQQFEADDEQKQRRKLDLAMYAAQLMTFAAPMMTAYSWRTTTECISNFVGLWTRSILHIVEDGMQQGPTKKIPPLSNTLCVLRNYFSSFSSHDLLTETEDARPLVKLLNCLVENYSSKESVISESDCALVMSTVTDVLSSAIKEVPKLHEIDKESPPRSFTSTLVNDLSFSSYVKHLVLAGNRSDTPKQEDIDSGVVDNILRLQIACSGYVDGLELWLQLLNDLVLSWMKLCSLIQVTHVDDISNLCRAIDASCRYFCSLARSCGLHGSAISDFDKAVSLMKYTEELQRWISEVPGQLKSMSTKSKEKQTAMKRSFKAFAAVDHAKNALQLCMLLSDATYAPAELSEIFGCYKGVSASPIVISQRAAATVLTLFILQQRARNDGNSEIQTLVLRYTEEAEHRLSCCMSSLARSLKQFDRFTKVMQKQLLKCLTVVYESMYRVYGKGIEERILPLHSTCVWEIQNFPGLFEDSTTSDDAMDGTLVNLSAKALTASLYVGDEDTSQAVQVHFDRLVEDLSTGGTQKTDEEETNKSKRDYAVPVLVTYLEELPRQDISNPNLLVHVLKSFEGWLSNVSVGGMPEDEQILLFAVEEFVNRLKQLHDNDIHLAASRLECYLKKQMT